MRTKSIETLSAACLVWGLVTAASCASHDLWPRTEEFLDRLECGMSEAEVAAIAEEFPGLEFKDSRRGTPWDKVAYKPQTSITMDFEDGGLRRAEVIWVDAILHAERLPIRDFCDS